MVFQLSKRLAFPDPHLGEPDGLLAIGGDLSIDRLLLAYSYGIFPWYAFKRQVIEWWCPMQRFVIFPSEIHISHSMRTLLNKDKYRITINQAFEEVIRHCGKLREGLYGVAIGRCFFGESMFSLVPSASKLALIHLAWFLEERGGLLIDCQFETPHLKSMGGRYISYEEYMDIISRE